MSDMISKLPYTLTTGVTAKREGLIFVNDNTAGLYFDGVWHPNTDEWVVSWPAAAERLRYRDGEPWCTSSDGEFTRDIVCHPGTRKPSGLSGFIFGEPIKDNPLHRLAAILCDDAEAFRLLHWCIHNMPQEAGGD